MDKLYIVVDGIEHQYFDCDSTGYYLDAGTGRCFRRRVT